MGVSTPLRWRFGAILAAFILASCAPDPLAGLENANDLLYNKSYLQAEQMYRKLFKRLQNKGELEDHEEKQRLLILERLGRINVLYLRDYKQAILDYSVLVDHYPKTEEARSAHVHMGDVYRYKLGQPEKSIDELQLLISKFPNHTDARRAQLEVVRIYLELKNYDQARTEAIHLRSNWPESRENKQAQMLSANSYYVQNRFTEAIAEYENLLEDKPGRDLHALVFFELASCYQELGEYHQALNYYYQCLPDHSNPRLVQQKIERVRARLRESGDRPAIRIPSPYKPKRTVAKKRPARTKAAPPGNLAAKSPKKNAEKVAKPAPDPKPVLEKQSANDVSPVVQNTAESAKPKPAAPSIKSAPPPPKPAAEPKDPENSASSSGSN